MRCVGRLKWQPIADIHIASYNFENLFDHERTRDLDPMLQRPLADELNRWAADVRDQKLVELVSGK
jgi:hypothetical protein